ncbi:uncharacterized protein LOC128652728 [Bombina bombina]|uniref:uncharacterized protein LOC128652728 n=1 Tax=Bombina bombina TaxID=8345 RepID=UPI00235AEA54|nr:uncharacterized protein LOC128652728 [Bombina bombina]
MLVTGRSEEAVLQRLMEYGLKVNLDKCQFMQDSLEFCAHVTDKHGLHTTDEKVKTLQDAPTPQNVTQLRSYLGLLNYYNRFLPNLAHMLYPLHRLLESKCLWHWTVECETAFSKSKELVHSSRLLVHYNLEKPLHLMDWGLFCLIPWLMEQTGQWLLPPDHSQKNYSQIKRRWQSYGQ